MLPDFAMVTQAFEDGADIRIYAISDVHYGAPEHLTREWELFCQSLLEDPHAYLILNGDMINNSTRGSIGNGVFTDIIPPSQQKKTMAKMLEPLRDRILFADEGNHEFRSGKDADDYPMYDIMCKLDIEDRYRPNIGFLKLQFGKRLRENGTRTDGRRRPTYVIAVTHGAGGGMLTGGAVNRNERFGYALDGIDMLIVGHTHKPFVTQPSKLKVDPQNNIVSVSPFKVVSATSWMTYGGYAARQMLLPSSHAKQIITLCGDHKEIRVTM